MGPTAWAGAGTDPGQEVREAGVERSRWGGLYGLGLNLQTVGEALAN